MLKIKELEKASKRKYRFAHYDVRVDEEKETFIRASSDYEAVMIFYDTIGLSKFACFRSDGHFFTDMEFPESRAKIEKGC